MNLFHKIAPVVFWHICLSYLIRSPVRRPLQLQADSSILLYITSISHNHNIQLENIINDLGFKDHCVEPLPPVASHSKCVECARVYAGSPPLCGAVCAGVCARETDRRDPETRSQQEFLVQIRVFFLGCVRTRCAAATASEIWSMIKHIKFKL